MQESTVLIVDDERGPRESLRMILSPYYRALVSSGASEALEILRTTPVDLVTIDLNMPGMRGDELMRTIRAEFPQVEVMVITGFGSMETAVEGLRHGICDYLTKPFDVVQVSAAVTRALLRQRSRRRLLAFLEGLGAVVGRDRDVSQVLEELDGDAEIQRRMRALLEEPILNGARARTGTGSERTIEFLEVLAEAIESRDPCMRGHARRVAALGDLFADRLCLGAEEREHVRISAFLHDIGKVGIPPEAWPAGDRLSPGQRNAFQQHPEIGERLVRPLDFASAIASAIRHHHERWDGQGYPDGLCGEQIPLASRIIAIADAFDAMCCERPWEAALSARAALGELERQARSQFDPDLVAQFVEIVERDGTDVLAPVAPAIGTGFSGQTGSAAPSAPVTGSTA